MQKAKKVFSFVLSCLLCLSLIPSRGIAEVTPKDPNVIASEEKQSDSALNATILYRIHKTGDAAWNDDAQGWSSQDVDILRNAGKTSDNGENVPIDALAMKLSDATGSLEYRLSSKDQIGAWTKDGQYAQVQNPTNLEIRLEGNLAESHTVLYRWHTAAGWSQWKGLPSDLKDTTVQSDEAAHALGADSVSASDADGSDRGFDVIDDVEIVLVPLQVADDYAESVRASHDAAGSSEVPAPIESTTTTKDVSVFLGQDEEAIQPQDVPAIVQVRSSEEDPKIEALASTGATVSYNAHVQSYGWLNWVSDGATSGTSGESKRMEALQLKLSGVNGGIRYRAHVQGNGWLGWVKNGCMAGTTGESRRMEAIQIELTGEAKIVYDVYYRAHVQSYGWLGWVKNGSMAGTTGESRRMEAIEIVLAPKGMPDPVGTGEDYMSYIELIDGATTPSVHYSVHAQSYGWLSSVADGSSAGTTGESKRLEAIRIALADIDGGVQYRAQVQDYGWMDWEADGDAAGTTGESRRMEAIQIKLTGNAAQIYDIYYRTYVEDYGWLGWAKNGEKAGTAYQAKRIESIQVELVEKGTAGPAPQSGAYLEQHHMDGVDISGWNAGIDITDLEADFTIIKSTEGVQGTIYNPDYKYMANTALACGKKIGFYHYANGGNATAEAESFYESIKAYKGRAIACLDWEGDGNKSFNTGIDTIWCKTFLDRLKALFGGTPFLYTSKNYTNAYNWSNVSKSYPLWGAQYADMNDVFGYQTNPWQSASNWGSWGPRPKIFQYSSTGVLVHDGGAGHLDLDLFYGSPAEWDSYCK